MTKQDTMGIVKVIRLLEYVQCSPISAAVEKIHYWDFVRSLADSYERHNSLTDKQYEALCNLINKHTECAVRHVGTITHEAGYSREGRTGGGTKERVDHDYGKLEAIQLYDLPFDSGSIVELEVHPYNSHSMVIELDGVPYKIPKPKEWDDLVDVTVKSCRYKRTEHKGYLKEER